MVYLLSAPLKEFGDPDAINRYLCADHVSQERQWDGYTCGAHSLKNVMIELGMDPKVDAKNLYDLIRFNTEQASSVTDDSRSSFLGIDELDSYIQTQLRYETYTALH